MYIYSITVLYINPHYHDCTKFQYDVSVFFLLFRGQRSYRPGSSPPPQPYNFANNVSESIISFGSYKTTEEPLLTQTPKGIKRKTV